ncbi:MAG: DUF5723 family protein, partial [Bacteroidota bacterium]
MKTKDSRNIAKFSLLVFFLAIMGMPAQSQQFHTLYWMQGIPQSTFANPGLQPNPNYFVGLPGISSIYTGIANTGFAMEDILKKNDTGGLYIDDESFLDLLRDREFMVFDVNVDILSFGFRARQKNYFTFSMSERVETRMGYSKDFIRLAVEGNDYFRQQGTEAQIGGFAMDLIHFREFAAGFSRKWTDQITAGARLKVLQGMANLNFERTNLGLFTAEDNYAISLRADMLINKSFPIVIAPLEDITGDFNLDDLDQTGYVTNFGNMGFAVDFGGVYQPMEKLSVAFSVRDLGFLQWKTDVENVAVKGELDFDGLDFDEIFGEVGEERIDEITDSIINLFDLQETTNAYTLTMNPRVFVSAAYHLTHMHKFAILGRGEMYAGNLYPSVTLSYNFQPINRFGSTLSYSWIHGNFHNI